MPDWFAPAAVLLPLSVLAVGWVAFQWSERQQRGPARRDHDDPLGAETLTMLSCIPSIVVVLDADGKILRADAMAYAKGLVRDGALAHAELRDLVAAARSSALIEATEVRVPRSALAATADLPLAVRAASLAAGRVLLLADDLSARRRHEQARQEFTANVSHELKTPIGAIRLLAETIATDPTDSATVAHFAPRLLTETERLTALVQDIIALNRLENTTPALALEPVEVAEVITAARAQVEVLAGARDVTLAVPTPPAGHVWGTPQLLITAVKNLLDNAVRHSPPGSTVEILVRPRGDLVSIAVRDAGPGIAPAHLPHIFTRFYRADPARSRATGGTGLGLAIVKHVAAEHGGSVSVSSQLGHGSTFTLLLPQAQGPAQAS